MVSTNTSEEIPIENVDLFISTRKLVARVKPKPIRERKWIDLDPQPFDHSCFEVSKFMTRTLRHESSIPREEDGAVSIDDLIEDLKENCFYFSMDSQNFGEFSGTRRRKEEKVSKLFESLFIH